VGRDPKYNDIVLPYDTISAQHAVIECRAGAFYLHDLRSTNGTLVNGKKLNEGDTVREIVLRNRDLIRFSEYEFEFAVDGIEDPGQTRFAGPALAPEARPQLGTPHPSAPVVAGAMASGFKPDNGGVRTKLKTEMCPRHQSSKATSLCPKCGEAHCEKCIIEKDGVAACVSCWGFVV
jgi:predicted component of type VI protein secretion system